MPANTRYQWSITLFSQASNLSVWKNSKRTYPTDYSQDEGFSLNWTTKCWRVTPYSDFTTCLQNMHNNNCRVYVIFYQNLRRSKVLTLTMSVGMEFGKTRQVKQTLEFWSNNFQFYMSTKKRGGGKEVRKDATEADRSRRDHLAPVFGSTDRQVTNTVWLQNSINILATGWDAFVQEGCQLCLLAARLWRRFLENLSNVWRTDRLHFDLDWDL